MKVKVVLFLTVFMTAAVFLAGSLTTEVRYQVTITNLTRGQVITPPLVFSHISSLAIFVEGEHPRTALTMLAHTHDAFFGIKHVQITWEGEKTVYANAYDAGIEENNETAAYIPAPLFAGALRSYQNAEKFVHIHPGIHGMGDLMASMYDWRNPAAKIAVRRTD